MKRLLLILIVASVSGNADLLIYTAKKTPLQESLILSGTVEPTVSEAVKTKWYALVKGMPVRVGQSVKKGDLLAEVETQYYAFRLEYLLQRQKLEETRLDQVQFEQRIIAARKRKLRDLATQNILSSNQVDETEAKSLEAQVRKLKAEKDIRDGIKQIAEVRRQIQQANYYAPIDGIISSLVVDPQQVIGSFMVGGDAPLARIDKPGKYSVRTTAIDTQASKISIGQNAYVYLEGTATPIMGQVKSISKSPQSEKLKFLAFEVEVEFERPGALVHRGILSRVEIPLGRSELQVTVPWNAIRVDNGKTSVLVENADGSSAQREVTLGLRSRHRVGILKGLAEGEKVLASLW